ncbi:MAG TPA: type IV toxin-antitoxin system AbiEi family antitoxin domain-containing protein [Acidimicrobiia bacterium]|nr:type IV toxin-antitoxin system AbiEi family antitoxin domain-containing protein [Acidimicrobiia bacterium]
MDDGALLRLAGRQHGLVAVRQLAPLGYTEHHLRRRVDAHRLFRVHRGVYAVTGSRDTFAFRVMADGDTRHTGLLDRMRDAARDEQCALLGWTVRRYATDDIRRRGRAIAEDVAALRREALAA